MSPPKVNNSTIKDLNNSELYEISNNELRRTLTRTVNKIKEPESFKKDTNKQLNGFKKNSNKQLK
jgi:hypothetical protein